MGRNLSALYEPGFQQRQLSLACIPMLDIELPNQCEHLMAGVEMVLHSSNAMKRRLRSDPSSFNSGLGTYGPREN